MAVIKTIDLVGVSAESWRDAGAAGAGRGGQDDPGHRVRWTSSETTAKVADGTISEYHTHVRIRFRIER